MTRMLWVALLTVMLGGVALAHVGVKNEAVKARMNAMKAVAAETKALGQMAKGAIPFDRDTARSAAGAIARHAADTPDLFRAQEDDPLSEAHPSIWDNFADFTAKSDALVALATELSSSIEVEADVVSAVRSLGTACKACHEPYTE